jgi:hypothetical protein
VPAVSAIVIGEVEPVPEVPSEPVTVKLVMALPPVAGAVKAIEFWSTPAVGVGAAIVAGTVVAVIDDEAADAAEVPAALVAVTVNVYAVAD